MQDKPDISNITALVTGGAGFIGSHIARELCRRGAKVFALDNLSLGTEDNLAWRREGDALEFVRGDIRDAECVRALLGACDWIFHHAALPSVPYSVDHPVETNAANLDATLQLLTAARDAGVRRFVFASSSAIYGDNDAPAKYEALPVQPLSPYALQKFAAERYGQLFFDQYGFETVALRYFNVFGPHQAFDSPYSGVIAKFCTCMLEGEAPTLLGDGLQSRDFVYIDNVVQANLLAATAPAERVAGRVFNIAGGDSITLLQLVDELNRLTGQHLVPKHGPPRTGDVRHSRADMTAAERDLSYRAQIPFAAGLERTLEFYRGSGPEASL